MKTAGNSALETKKTGQMTSCLFSFFLKDVQEQKEDEREATL